MTQVLVGELRRVTGAIAAFSESEWNKKHGNPSYTCFRPDTIFIVTRMFEIMPTILVVEFLTLRGFLLVFNKDFNERTEKVYC